MGANRHMTLRRLGAILLAGGLTAGLAAAPAAVLAGSVITVNTTANDVVDDGDCTLREAIAAANTDTASGATTGECVAGSGSDTIVFDVSGTISVTTGNALPGITQDVTIEGADAITIDGSSQVDSAFGWNGSEVHLTGLTLRHFTGYAVAYTGSATLTSVTISANGGGISVATSSSLTLTDSVIDGNEATSGGGISVNEGSTATLTRTTVSGNAAAAEGGGLRVVGSTVTLDRSTVSGNEANEGGGIYLESPTAVSTLRLWNSTVAENFALGKAGGIFRQGNIELRSSTIAANDGGPGAGGGVLTDGTGWTLVLVNTAILGNTTNSGASDWANGIAGELSGAVASKIGLGGATFADYFFPPALADNGGPTQTLKPKVTSTNQLIDHGNSTQCAASPISGKDQRGYGRVSPCDIGAVEVDRTKPVVSGVVTTLRKGVALSGTSSRARVGWNGADSGSGIARYTIQRRVDGGSWSTLATGVTSRFYDVTLTRTHDYAFRVRAIDVDGNVGSYANSATFEARVYQQTSSAFAFGGSWATSSDAAFSGGSTRRSSSNNSSSRFTATGRSFAWITTLGPTRGSAKIYVNGTYIETVDLFSPTTQYRVQVWARSYSSSVSKSIRVVVSGSGERVDVDAFAVLR